MYYKVFVRAWNRKRISFTVGVYGEWQLTDDAIYHAAGLTEEEKKYAAIQQTTEKKFQHLPAQRPAVVTK
jgi:hypothetical protein